MRGNAANAFANSSDCASRLICATTPRIDEGFYPDIAVSLLVYVFFLENKGRNWLDDADVMDVR